jgi:hypothetical protein
VLPGIGEQLDVAAQPELLHCRGLRLLMVLMLRPNWSATSVTDLPDTTSLITSNSLAVSRSNPPSVST